MMWKIGGANNSDRRLAKRAAVGEHGAGDELVQLYYESVRSYMLALCRNPATAEDLTQATFAACWKSLSTYEGKSSLRTWIHRIAHRQYSRWLESSRNHLVLSDDDAQPGFESEVVNSLWIHTAIEQLEPELRETLVLFYLQEMTCQEIADVLAIPRGTVLSRLHTARGRLRTLLTASEGGQEFLANPADRAGGTKYEMSKASS